MNEDVAIFLGRNDQENSLREIPAAKTSAGHWFHLLEQNGFSASNPWFWGSEGAKGASQVGFHKILMHTICIQGSAVAVCSACLLHSMPLLHSAHTAANLR